MSDDCSASVSDTPEVAQPQKRKAGQAGLDGNGSGRSVKRRASKACQCCRARKVRCNVTEHGAPCTNCRLDEVECIVSESRRKKKWSKDEESQNDTSTAAANLNSRKIASRDALDAMTTLTGSRRSHDAETSHDEHVPHSIYQTHGNRLNYTFQELNRRMSSGSASHGLLPLGCSPFATDSRQPCFTHITPKAAPTTLLPLFIKPLPSRVGAEEITYLERKGALSIPSNALRNELLRAYIEFVHPYMPLLDLHDFVLKADRADGTLGKISLILFQAVMFAGSAFVDMRYLRSAGYKTRKEARKDLFQRTRLLYDFDYESDRVSLVQALLLLTYYYETPDDQKDTWHWMGVATSVAHTIGLHRNPDKSNMDKKRTKLWKRIWWSTYMRDRLIALGMRRPTRIKTEDYDVPMITLDDFDISPVPETVSCVPADCTIARDVEKQRQLAIMCIEKAKLCLCISNVLSKQYCVLNNSRNLVSDRTTMMLLPKKLDPETSEVETCDQQLQKWLEGLHDDARYSDAPSGNASIDLHRSLLHMVFFTTLSALHRPQVLPSAPSSAPTPGVAGKSNSSSDLLETSRCNVRRAAAAITNIAQNLDAQDLVRYLPTTGVTVLLPAIIIHLLDIKAPDEETRRTSLRGFCQCMQVMGKLRDLYAAADYSTAFLEAAIRKAGIPIQSSAATGPTPTSAPEKPTPVNVVEDLAGAGRKINITSPLSDVNGQTHTLTPPPDSVQQSLDPSQMTGVASNMTSDEEVARRLETFLASTPPDSDHSHTDGSETNLNLSTDDVDDSALFFGNSTNSNPMSGMAFASNIGMNSMASFGADPMGVNDFDEGDFEALLNLDAAGEAFAFDDGTPMALQGESGGLLSVDMDWMKTMG